MPEEGGGNVSSGCSLTCVLHSLNSYANLRKSTHSRQFPRKCKAIELMSSPRETAIEEQRLRVSE